MIDVMAERDLYLSTFAQFEKAPSGNAPPWVHHLRKEAIERFAELGFPTLHDEEWRFTPVTPLARVPFQLAGRDRPALSSERLAQLAPDAGDAHRLVFMNGHFAEGLSSISGLSGTAASLAAALQAHPDRLQPHLARHARFDEHPFVALNTAFLRDGALLLIPKGMVVEKPIHLVFVSTAPGQPTVSHPRNLVVLGENSQATLVESYVGSEGEVYFTNAVTEVVLGENAFLDHYKLQEESRQAFHIATLQVQQARGSNFCSHAITRGGALVRTDINAVLADEGCECTLNGLYLGRDRQLIDNHTRIDHAKPHCTSHELYKGILDERARGVFNGKIYVHPGAQKTDAKQTNQTLLLSDDAQINTKPQLEIFADDVKCTHGATVGQLAGDAIFYLRSRGIGRDQARSILTFAFANDIISRIKVEPIRQRLEQMLLASQPAPSGLTAREAS
jgi:Fe-S cluster assembly protein SufD